VFSVASGHDSAGTPDGRIPVATAADMQALGQRIATVLRAGDLVVLTGPLGAGKTTLVQGIGQGLDVPRAGDLPDVRHRPGPSAAERRPGPGARGTRTGWAVWLKWMTWTWTASLEDCVTVVEWGEGLVEELADDRLEVTITMPPAGEPGEMRWGKFGGNRRALGIRRGSARCALPMTPKAI